MMTPFHLQRFTSLPPVELLFGVLAFSLAHAGLSASWDMDDGFDPAFRLKCIAVLDPLVDA